MSVMRTSNTVQRALPSLWTRASCIILSRPLMWLMCSQTKLLAGLTDVPFSFINAITGGSPLTTALNQRLAILARETGMAMATGSMSIAMKFPESTQSFKVIRQENPNGILFANLGAHYNAEAAKRAVDIIK